MHVFVISSVLETYVKMVHVMFTVFGHVYRFTQIFIGVIVLRWSNQSRSNHFATC